MQEPIKTMQFDKKQPSNLKYILILGLLSMLMPLSIDMYLPSFLAIEKEFNVDAGMVQLTLTAYIAGFAVGQLFYGPMSDTVGRKPVIIVGLIVFTLASIGCAFASTIEELITLRLLHGLAAASSAVVINALIRDLFNKEEFSRMMSFVTLVMTIAPLLAPIIGGWLLIWFDWHATFWVLAAAAIFAIILVKVFIPETLKKEQKQRFSFSSTARNLVSLFRHRKVICYMMASALSFSGLFSFLSSGPFVYMKIYGVAVENFGYYFALNIIVMIIMTSINSRNVRRKGAARMIRFGLTVQLSMALCLLLVLVFQLNFLFVAMSVAGFIGCTSMISSNSMALILEDFPFMAGTVASLAGTIRFGTGALVGYLLSFITAYSAWPMAMSMIICASLSAMLYYIANKTPTK